MTQKETSVPPEKQRLYEQMLASVEGIEAKSNFGSGYTAINGNMYTMISKHGVVGIRLPEASGRPLSSASRPSFFAATPPGLRQKEFVAVPVTLLADIDTLRPYLESSYRYARLSSQSQPS